MIVLALPARPADAAPSLDAGFRMMYGFEFQSADHEFVQWRTEHADDPLGPVSQADPESLAMVLQHEQPQTVALVVSSLEPLRAAAVVEKLPEKQRPDILRRMASIDSVSPEVLREIGQALSTELRALVAGGMRKVEGKNIALEIQKTFDFFKATSSEDRIDRIFLSGGTAKVPGLRELLGDRFEAGVEFLNPFNNVTYNPRDFDPEYINEVAPSSAIAVGLAVRRVGDR